MNKLIKLYRLLMNRSQCCGIELIYWGDQGYCDKENGGCGKRDF